MKKNEDKRRVVITGLGTVNSVAKGIGEFVSALKAGVCGIGEITVFDTEGSRTKTGAEVADFNPRAISPGIPAGFSTKRMSRSDLLAMAAAIEALHDSGLFPVPDSLREETGLVIGGGAGGIPEAEKLYREYLDRGADGVKFSRLASLFSASSADHIASKLELMGPKTTFMTACSSGATAIGYGRDLIRDGLAKVIIAGGTEPLSMITYASFNSLRSVDPEYCKPFDKNRQGLSLGEGAGMMILEPLEDALGRGAKIYGELLGYGITCDSHHMTAPDPKASGAARAMLEAMRDAGIAPDRVDYINAHGTATPANDVAETNGIKAVFKERAYDIPVSSTKSMIGHTLGAAGALEGLASVLAIYHGFIPPTIHLMEPDPECDLDYVTEGARDKSPDIVLSNSFAFGGNNTTVVFGRYTEKGIANE
ncbi:MAG: beta-ketoacyl-[acyl-carrier-protein] synthase family protein [Deltaproteobacteria bacterium]|uniref:Beta-ketoacyl-[acyl-carrier-protein] synthase family protein n=1 Tax=Candidatus Zymogenus saltonus TaxID=2844893 RepID=A0A9D8KHC6_9DELT|nr:beta-ketoacyl-[acyl-carrier-protein] synthase family protein [Candidatus Zymogenus saltonus]